MSLIARASTAQRRSRVGRPGTDTPIPDNYK